MWRWGRVFCALAWRSRERIYDRYDRRSADPGGATLSVDVLIPTLDRKDLLGRCLRALPAAFLYAPSHQVFVWDNSTENVGYSAAINRAAKLGSSEWLLLLNDDVVLDPAAVRRLLDVATYAGRHEDIVGGTLLFGDRSRIQHAGITFRSDGRPAQDLLGKSVSDLPSLPCVVPAVSFAAVLIRRATFESLGGLDESYFLDFSDVDFCLRYTRETDRRPVLGREVGVHDWCQSGVQSGARVAHLRKDITIYRDRWAPTWDIESDLASAGL